MDPYGYILSWDTSKCAAKRAVVDTTYKIAGLNTAVPTFPPLSLVRIIEQLVGTGVLMRIGETDDRVSYAVVEEFRDADIVDWKGVMRDAVTVFKDTKKVVVRQDTSLEKEIVDRIEQHETYVLGPEIGRLIHSTLMTNVQAVPIKQGVVFVPGQLPTTIMDMWEELANGLAWLTLEQYHSLTNKLYLTQLCKNHLRKRADKLEGSLIKALTKEGGPVPNKRGIDYKRLASDEIRDALICYETALNQHMQSVHRKIGRINRLINILEKGE